MAAYEPTGVYPPYDPTLYPPRVVATNYTFFYIAVIILLVIILIVAILTWAKVAGVVKPTTTTFGARGLGDGWRSAKKAKIAKPDL